MKKLIGIVGVLLLLAIVFDVAMDKDIYKVECSTEDVDFYAGFSKYLHSIDIEVTSSNEEDLKRTESRIETNKEISKLEEIKSISNEENNEDIELIAHLVRCEAGNQSLDGKRAVVDVVLNRVDSEKFPNSVYDVIHQAGQFTCLSDGNWEKYESQIDETDYEAVELELANRTNSEIIYFSSQNCTNGKLVCVIGDHFFAR